ncbi:unnamed protein product, partial [Meganyctiphanes norvegica]
MNKITNANMFNWTKKKEKHQAEEPKVGRKESFSEEPKVGRKGSFSLTDTLRRSKIKAKLKDTKKNVDTEPQKPQVSVMNPQLSNKSNKTNPEKINVNNGTTQLSIPVAQVKDDDKQRSKEDLKINYENIQDNKNQDPPLQFNGNKSNEEELQKSVIKAKFKDSKEDIDTTAQKPQVLIESQELPNASTHPHYENFDFKHAINQLTEQVTQMIDDVDEMSVDVDEQISNDKINIKDDKELHNKNQDSSLKDNEDKLNNEEAQKSVVKAEFEEPNKSQVPKKNPKLLNESIALQTNPNNVHLKKETTQLTDEESQMAANDEQISIEKLEISNKDVLNIRNQESSLEVNEDKENKEEIKKSVIKANPLEAKEDTDTTTQEQQVLIKVPQIPNESIQTNPENVNMNNYTTQLSVKLSQAKADDEHITKKELKIIDGDDVVLDSKNQKSSIEVNEKESNKEKVQKSLIKAEQISKEDLKINYENIQDKKNQESPLEFNGDKKNEEELQKSKEDIDTTAQKPQVLIETQELHNESTQPHYENYDFKQAINQLTEQVTQMFDNVDEQISNEELKINDDKVLHNKNQDSYLKNNEDKSNNEEVQKSVFKAEFEEPKEVVETTPQTLQVSINNTDISNEFNQTNQENINVNHETTQQSIHMSQMTADDKQISIKELKVNEENVLHSKEQESSSEDNKNESNKDEVQKSVIKSELVESKEDIDTTPKKPQVPITNPQLPNDSPQINAENVNANNDTTQLTVQVSQIKTDDDEISIEELKINNENVQNSRNQESSIEINQNESNKKDVQKLKRVSQICIEKEDISLSIEEEEEENITNKDNSVIKSELVESKEDIDTTPKKPQVPINNPQLPNDSPQINAENVNANNDTTQLTVQVSQIKTDDDEISIEELKINNENVQNSRNQESSIEINQNESNKEEVQKLKRVSQISFEKEDISLSIEEEEENITNKDTIDNKEIGRNSSFRRRSIKVELTIIDSQNKNTPRRHSQTSLENEGNRCSSNISKTDYPEELNPFAEDEEEDIASDRQEEENVKAKDNHYNPFDSESDNEDAINNEKIKIVSKATDNNEVKSVENNSGSYTSLTTRNKNIENSDVKRKCRELPGGSLPPSPKAPTRRRVSQARSLQCLTKCEKGEDFTSKDHLKTHGKPTQLPKSTISIHTTSSGISSAGSNPFEDEEDENELEAKSEQNKHKTEVESKIIRSPSPSLSINDSVTSLHSTPTKTLNGSTHYNPFDEDEEDDEFESNPDNSMMRGATSRCSLAISPSNSSSFNRGTDIRCSLPPTAQPRKKRKAPLPPGQ